MRQHIGREVGWVQLGGGLLFFSSSLSMASGDGRGSLLLHGMYLVLLSLTLWPLRLVLLKGAAAAGSRAHSFRSVWQWWAGAMLAWFMGDLLWTARAVADAGAPELGVDDVAYLAFYPLALHALAHFPGLGETRLERWRIQLDALLAALTVGTVFLWFWPQSGEPGAPLAWLVHVVHIANPIGDLMLLTAVAVLRTPQMNEQSAGVLRTLMLALAVKALADTLHAGAVIANLSILKGLTGALWLSFFGIVSLCAGRGSHALEPSPVNSRAPEIGWLPYASVVLTGMLLLESVFSGNGEASKVVAVGTVALSLSVLLRQALVSQENRRLDRLATEGAAESRLAALVRHSHDIVVVVDAAGLVGYASPSVERILARAPEQLVGLSGFALIHPDDVMAMEQVLNLVLEFPDRSQALVTRARHGDGTWREMEIIATNRLATSSIHGIVLNLRDVTERRELEGKLEWQAFHDPMTGLANRVLFTDRVKHALTRRQRSAHDIGVLFIDLDNFKVVNDTLGHHAGDALLREAARRIAIEVRGADTVARLGGDEFAVLLEEATREQCQQTAERLLVQLTRAFVVEGCEVFTGASIGLTMADIGATYEELVRDADVAMYVAKAEGRGRVVAFHDSMRVEITERLLLEANSQCTTSRRSICIRERSSAPKRSFAGRIPSVA
jgi:diguanylate cyclase (GGDEF)-like protein/PAS domain S-box-containing protein